MVTSLADLLGASAEVVVASVAGPNGRGGYALEVERPLRGGRAPGRLEVTARAGATAPFPAGTRLVAFLGAGGQWHAAATLAKGARLEDGVLHVAGLPVCCDASVVSPGVLTLAQLSRAVAGAPLAWTFRGALELPGPAGPGPSSIVLEVEAGVDRGAVRGLPAAAGFPPAEVRVGAPPLTADVTITYATTAGRPLRLFGEAVGAAPDGSLATKFTVDRPTALAEPLLRKYLADPSLAYPYYVVRVAGADGASLRLELGKDVGRIGDLVTATGRTPVTRFGIAPARELVAGEAIVTFDPPRVAARGGGGGAVGSLVTELIAGPVACTYATPAGTKPCVASLEATKFVSAPAKRPAAPGSRRSRP
jgi:hypothetical protein